MGAVVEADERDQITPVPLPTPDPVKIKVKINTFVSIAI